ncbi:MAG: MATE family efflux transporter [Bacteroides sp.]|jgi:putative MATE family efflux protein|nr:MATE family efflux transporter [Bacteroides sp.]MCI1682955.1 MATE family efflux transporter [Bacteroides sp.]
MDNNPHILSTERIGKLLLQYSIPAIIGMTITSIYNIIDSVFIGHGVGAMAIAGLAITFPLMNLVVAFCTLVSSGGSTLSSIRLGQKDLKGATEILGHTLMLCIINAFIFGGLSFLFLDKILLFFGASHNTLPYARDFMQIILLGSPIAYVMIGLNNIMRATGYPKKAMLTSMVTVFSNIILAPIFIFYFHWGIRGAATATVISQFIGMIWVVKHFINKSTYVRFGSGFWIIKRRIVSNIFSIGMSPFLMNVCACIIVIIVNNSLQKYGGDMAVGAFGIINRMMTLYVMIVIGLTMGMQPIVGYNFGAQKHDRVKQTLRLSIIVGVCITSSGFIICELFPNAVSAIFTNDNQLISIASRGVRFCLGMFPLVGAQIVIGNFFQSIGKAKMSIFLSLTRQLLFLLPGLIIFPHIFGLDGIWISMPVSDFLAVIVAIISLMVYIRRSAHT